MPGHIFEGVIDVLAVGVGIRQHTLAALAAQQVVHRRIESLPLDVPQRKVHGPDRRHRYRSPPPIRSAIEILPDVFGLKRVAADDAGNHVVAEIAGDRQLASVQRAVSQPIDALAGLNLQGHKVASRRCDVHRCARNLH